MTTPPRDFEAALASLPRPTLSDAARQRHLAMLADLAAGTPGRRRWRRWRRWTRRRKFTVTGLSLLLAGGVGIGVAGASGLFSAPPVDQISARCFATADLHDPDNWFEFNAGPALGNGNSDTPAHAVDVCSAEWEDGRLSSTAKKAFVDPPSPPEHHPVPPLIACVLRSGEVGVFPGTEQTCHDLDLPVAEI